MLPLARDPDPLGEAGALLGGALALTGDLWREGCRRGGSAEGHPRGAIPLAMEALDESERVIGRQRFPA